MAASIIGTTTFSSGDSASDPLTWSHTVASGTTVLVVTAGGAGSPVGASGVTWNGSALTKVKADSYNGAGAADPWAELWILENPTAATGNVVITPNDSTPNAQTGTAINLTGTPTTSSVDVSNNNSASSGSPTVSLTTTEANTFVIDSMAHRLGGTITKDGTQTLLKEYEDAHSGAGDVSWGTSYKEVASSGSTSMDWTTGGGDGWAHVAAAFKSSAEVEQEGFAFGDDDGNEASHTLDTQDTNVTEALGTKTLRLLLNGTGDPASKAFKLKYQKNGSGGYVDVPVGATTEATPTVSDATTDGDNTTGTSIVIDYPAYSTSDLIVINLIE